MSNEKIKKVISILTDTRDEIHELLGESPDLQIRASNALERLINGFAHASGEKMQFAGDKKKANKREPLKTIGGIDYKPKHTRHVKEAEPSKEEKEELDGYIEQVYEEFKTDTPKSLLAGANDLVIRAVAKKAGIEVSPDQPCNYYLAFIEKVKAAILKKEDTNGKGTEIKLPNEKK